MTNKDLQNIAQKTKDRATRTPLKSRGELMCSGGIAVPAPSVAHVVLLLLQTGASGKTKYIIFIVFLGFKVYYILSFSNLRRLQCMYGVRKLSGYEIDIIRVYNNKTGISNFFRTMGFYNNRHHVSS
jgi:hypothetical protein